MAIAQRRPKERPTTPKATGSFQFTSVLAFLLLWRLVGSSKYTNEAAAWLDTQHWQQEEREEGHDGCAMIVATIDHYRQHTRDIKARVGFSLTRQVYWLDPGTKVCEVVVVAKVRFVDLHSFIHWYPLPWHLSTDDQLPPVCGKRGSPTPSSTSASSSYFSLSLSPSPTKTATKQ